jgi:hypothetical protein
MWKLSSRPFIECFAVFASFSFTLFLLLLFLLLAPLHVADDGCILGGCLDPLSASGEKDVVEADVVWRKIKMVYCGWFGMRCQIYRRITNKLLLT